MSTSTYETINAKDKPIAEDFVYVYSEIEDGGFRKVSKAMLKVLLGVATKLSELENDKEFITKTVSELENYYLKSETYSKDEIDNRISLIPRFDVQVVSSLPTTDISETTVYLVSSGDDSDNLYTEYINVNGLWEILGTQKIASVENAVLYTSQSLTDEQKTQARTNIDAASSEKVGQLEETIADYKNYVTPQMFGAKADGTTDDTQAIQLALDASSYVYIPDGTYMIDANNDGWGYKEDGGIKPKSNQTIILSNNAILKAKTNSTGFYNIVNLVNVENVHIKGGKVVGEKDTHDGTSGQFGFGVNILASTNITIEQMEVYNCWGDSIFIGYTDGVDSHNVKIYNCVLHDSRRQGISITGCTDAIIKDCEIYNISGSAPQFGIDIEPDGTGIAENITIDNCYIHDNGVGDIVVTGGSVTKNVNITNCTVQKLNCTGGIGVYIDKCVMDLFYSPSPYQVVCSNSFLNRVSVAGSTVIFNNCDFKNNPEKTYVIAGTLDIFLEEPRVSNLYFNYCRFVTDEATEHFIKINGNYADLMPDDTIEFINCTMELGVNCDFCNRIAGVETRLEGCRITFNKSVSKIFAIDNLSPAKLIVNNTTIETPAIVSRIVKVETSAYQTIEISNCKLPDATNLITCSNGATGKIRLLNNEMNATSIEGTHTFDVLISNAIDTVPTTNSMNLITSGAVKAVEEKIPTKLSQMSEDTTHRVVTDAEKQAWNAKSTFSGDYNDLTNKPTIPEGVDLTGYATETYVKEYAQPKGNYLTQHQDISGKANKSDAEDWIFTLADGSTVTKKVVLVP